MEVDSYIGISAICGEEGTCKTSMALSYPQKLFHLDVDVGGFRRAAWRLEGKARIKECSDGEDVSKIDWEQYDIITKPYPRKVINVGKLLGQTREGTSIRFPKKVEGMKELWQAIITDFVVVCQVPSIQTVIIDSATLLWFVAHNTRLEELQEKELAEWNKDHPNTQFDENRYRERLLPVEYGPPNDRMRTVYHTARSFRKNLVLTLYPTDEYGTIMVRGEQVEGKTGRVVMDGFKETGKMADLIVWTSIKETAKQGGGVTRKPVCKITKCGVEGMGLGAVGTEIVATFEDFVNYRNTMRSANSA